MILLKCVLLLVFWSRADDCNELLGRSSNFAPIRIHVHYSQRGYDRQLTELIMPRVVEYFSKAVEVRRESGPLRLARSNAVQRDGRLDQSAVTRCGDTLVPETMLTGGRSGRSGVGVEADMVVFVKVESGLKTSLAFSTACFSDACGRPLAGHVTIGKDLLSDSSPGGLDFAISTMIHEFIHLLGFDYSAFRLFREADMTPRVPERNPIYYECSQEVGENRFAIKWNVARGPNVKKFYFAPEIVKPIEVRGVGLSKCRCPNDPTKTYTNADIEECLRHPNNCAMAIVTPGVQRAAREYFGCDSAEGMELENAFGFQCDGIHQSHWKQRVIERELMTGSTPPSEIQFISPMTFALLEDSGWYRTNAAMRTPIGVDKVFWGQQAGCDFLKKKCINSNHQLVAGNNLNFCDPTAPDALVMRCSPDRRERLQCNDGERKHTKRADTVTQLSQYQYAGQKYLHGQVKFDHCPVYQSFTGSLCVDPSGKRKFPDNFFGYDSRCMEVARFVNRGKTEAGTHAAECMRTVCAADRKSYRVIFENKIFASSECLVGGQIVYVVKNRDKAEIVCAEPSVICANWKYPHLFNSMKRVVPGSRGESLAGIVQTAEDSPANVDFKAAASTHAVHAILIFVLMPFAS